MKTGVNKLQMMSCAYGIGFIRTVQEENCIALLSVLFYTVRMNNAIITVVGSDQVGIIAAVSAFLAEKKINIADISQTILSGNFVMMMMVDLSSSLISVDELRKSMKELEDKMHVEINIMHERVFSAMQRV